MKTTKADLVADLFPDEEILQMDGFDDCIVGYVERCGSGICLCYDESKILGQLMAENDWDWEEAIEYYEFNIVGAYVGPGTPFIFTPIEDEE